MRIWPITLSNLIIFKEFVNVLFHTFFCFCYTKQTFHPLREPGLWGFVLWKPEYISMDDQK